MPDYYRVAMLRDVPEDGGLEIEVEGQAIGIFRLESRVVAIEAVCPHRAGPLVDGEVDGDVVICPWHGWEFSLRTGQCTNHPAHRVQRYAVRLEGDEIWVSLTPAE